MSNIIKTVKEMKDKNGELVHKITTIQPKKKDEKISLSTVDDLYKKLRVQSKKDGKKFMIKVMTYDGMKTLNGYNYDEESLKYCFEDYYENLPADIQKKFSNFFFIQIFTFLQESLCMNFKF